MAGPLVIATERPGLIVRELWTPEDDVAYQRSYERSRPEIEASDPGAPSKYHVIEEVEAARQNAGDRLRLGIWDGGTFVGSVNTEPDGEGVEVGYWVDSRFAGRGIATAAVRAVVNKYPIAHAQVVEGNAASERVLDKVGFRRQRVAKRVGELSFEYFGPAYALFPQFYAVPHSIPKGEYRTLEGSDAPVVIEPGKLFLVTGGDRSFSSDPYPGVHSRGLYVGPDGGRQVVSFLYHKLDANGALETDERLMITEGVGYGVNPGHTGQPPSWYLFGPQIGTIDHESGELLTEPEIGVEVPVKHFSMACITDGPLHPPVLANPKY